MNANEARAISDSKNIKRSQIPMILEKISEWASEGVYSYSLPGEVSDEDASLLRGMGYKVVYYPNPDPGHPCLSSFTTISW